MSKNTEVNDNSITFPKYPNKYGALMFDPKEIVTKPDTSTSIVVNWRNSKKMSPVTPEKEDLNIVYKSSTFTDGDEKGQKLDLHMNIMYHPNSKEPTKIILFTISSSGIVLVPNVSI